MKVIICGAGQVGWQIARHLSGERNDVTVVDNNPDLVRRATDTLDVQGIAGFASYPDVLEKAGVPSGPIMDIAQVYADPQIEAREMAVELDHPSAGRVKNIGIPTKLSRTPGSLRSAAPTLGQHTDEVLGDFGYSDDDIARLRVDGALG